MSLDEVGVRPKSSPSKEVLPDTGKSAKKLYWCDLCGAPMLDLHCKLICRRCGFKRDCSDP
ncbi:hypothetical protein MNODULE_01125 [Nitrospiraceae bacterium HYJII51-Mn-bac16s-1-B09]|uniref:Uncharacterized protein n=1 Tax=Candidatus Manganitrophus noduliformans TaxID=2606439 RepID=A0A7X6I9G8_9BACT|nr:hypothetical protein [Candidatus Manganitrophus noduliformans]